MSNSQTSSKTFADQYIAQIQNTLDPTPPSRVEIPIPKTPIPKLEELKLGLTKSGPERALEFI